MTGDPFGLVTQNVRSFPLMRQLLVTRSVKSAAAQGDVILWQEIVPARYKSAVRALSPAFTSAFASEGGEAISWRDSVWSWVSEGESMLHPAIKGVTKGRTIFWVDLRHNVTGVVVRFFTCHFISGAWNPKPRPQKMARKGWWLEARQRMADLFAEWVIEGVTVAGGGDFNWSMKFGSDTPSGPLGSSLANEPVEYLTPNKPTSTSIDWLFKIDGEGAGLVVVSDDTLTPDNPSDHRGRKAVLRPVVRG